MPSIFYWVTIVNFFTSIKIVLVKCNRSNSILVTTTWRTRIILHPNISINIKSCFWFIIIYSDPIFCYIIVRSTWNIFKIYICSILCSNSKFI